MNSNSTISALPLEASERVLGLELLERSFQQIPGDLAGQRELNRREPASLSALVCRKHRRDWNEVWLFFVVSVVAAGAVAWGLLDTVRLWQDTSGFNGFVGQLVP